MPDQLSTEGLTYLDDLATLATWTGGRSDLDGSVEVRSAIPGLVRDVPTVIELREQLDTLRAAETDSMADTLSAATARLDVCGVCERHPN